MNDFNSEVGGGGTVPTYFYFSSNSTTESSITYQLHDHEENDIDTRKVRESTEHRCLFCGRKYKYDAETCNGCGAPL